MNENSILLKKRIESNEKFRKERINTKSTYEAHKTPWSFVQRGEYDKAYNGEKNKFSIIIPRVSSSSRIYVPMGVVKSDVIISDSAMAIYNAQLWILGVLESKMHMIWLEHIGGKLKNDYRYSSSLVYNTFPVPKISEGEKKKIENFVLDIMDIRDEEGGNLSELYGSPLAKKNPKRMNERLLNKHKELDDFIDSLYTPKCDLNDNDRLSVLLNMYNEKIKGEK